MSHQTFLFSPKFNKKPIYNSPSNKYQEFTNTYVYSIIVKTGNGIPNRNDVCREATKEWNEIKSKSKSEIDEIIRNYLATPYNLYDIQTMRPRRLILREESTPPSPPVIRTVDPVIEIPVNGSAQRKAANEISIAEKKLIEFEQIYNIATDPQIRHDMYARIVNLRDEIKSNRERIVKLKRNANYAQKCKEKKRKLLIKNQEVVLYDKPGHPSLLYKHPNLHDHIHDLIEFGAADEKR